ncbi:MAG: Asp-tRNA(Asn)/Glu-tRNA(Gln) amidotransferase subunit GatA [Patescibacteria group bacterium]|nr:Asp-tRNA(Asn)/Glu-tRNA(Gln) amidotransferase subunit GatA [Patescibacteria group bacterium]
MYNSTIQQARQNYENGTWDPKTVAEDFMTRIQEVEPKIGSYISLQMDTAVSQAEDIDTTRSPIAGSFVSIKDLICTKDTETTAASKMLRDFIPFYDATVVEKLKEAGVISLGKTNLDEFAMGGSCENSALQKTRNPWNTNCVPGGSSGGSAASVAAGECHFSLGTDTGGSVRQPASFCGIVGFKPSYGRVSRYGVIPMANSLDQVGICAKTSYDTALVLQQIAGYDDKDSTSMNIAVPHYSEELQKGVSGLKVGVPEEFFAEGLDPGVREKVEAAIEDMKSLGMEVKPVNLKLTKYALPAYYIIMAAEASTNLSRYDGIRFGETAADPKDLEDLYQSTRGENFGDEVKRRIMLGSFALSSGFYDAYYAKAQKVRTLIKQEFEEVFKEVDVIIGPTAPTVAYEFGAKKDPLSMYLGDTYTIPVNLAGLPAVSTPCGFVDGMPVGLQIIGQSFQDDIVLRVSHAYEMLSDFVELRAEISPIQA